MKKILILFILSSLLLSCDKDDNNAVANTNLNGNWNMHSFSAIMPALPELNPEGIVWIFNGNTLTIENVAEALYPYTLTPGTYNITVLGNVITIEDNETYFFEIQGNQLKFLHPDAPSDPPVMIFTRNQ